MDIHGLLSSLKSNKCSVNNKGECVEMWACASFFNTDEQDCWYPVAEKSRRGEEGPGGQAGGLVSLLEQVPIQLSKLATS